MSTDYNFDDYENDLGLDEEDRKHAKSDSDIEWYKGVKGKTDRASLVYFHTVDVEAVNAARKKNPSMPREELIKVAQKALADRAGKLSKTPDQLSKIERLDLGHVHFKKVVSHFGGEGIGYVLSKLGKEGPESDEVWKRLEPPKTHFTTVLVLYPSNKKGELDKSQLVNGWRVMPWRFSPKRYDLIWKVNSGLVRNGASIANQDLLLECKDDKFQNIEITADGPATWLKHDKFKEMVLAKAVELYDKLVPFREMSTEQLRSKLGLGGGGGSSAVEDISNADFQGLIESV